jgi:hypothetical protein
VPDEDDRPRDAASAAGASWSDNAGNDTSWAEVNAPDDISGLAKDIAAYRREQRLTRRRALVHRYVARPGAPILTGLFIALVLAGVIAAMLTALRPNHAPPLQSSATLAQPAIGDGETGGLLPPASLRAADGTGVSARLLRPGVIALLTPSCACDDTVVQLAQATSTNTNGRLPLYAVAPTSQRATADALAGRLPAGDAVYLDPQQQSGLASRIGIDNLTLVFVNRDGTIDDILRDVTGPSNALHAELVSMLANPSPSS